MSAAITREQIASLGATLEALHAGMDRELRETRSPGCSFLEGCIRPL